MDDRQRSILAVGAKSEAQPRAECAGVGPSPNRKGGNRPARVGMQNDHPAVLADRKQTPVLSIHRQARRLFTLGQIPV